MWGFIPNVGIFKGSVGIIFFKWGLKFWKKVGNFCKMLGFFEKTGEILAKCRDFFQKLLGFIKKSGEIFAKCGDFWEENLVGTSGDFRQIWWGFSAGTFRQHCPSH